MTQFLCFVFCLQLVKNCRIHSEPYGFHGFDPHCKVCDPAIISVFDKAAEEINTAAAAMAASDSVSEEEPMDMSNSADIDQPAADNEEGLEDYEDHMDVLDLRPVDVIMADVHNEHTTATE